MEKTKKIATKASHNESTVKMPKKSLKIIGISIIVIGLLYGLFRISIVALVNGRLITRCSVIKELEKQSGATTLNVIILKTLVNQEAKKKNIVISQKEIDAEIKQVEESITSQGMTLDDLLAQQGMAKEDLISEVKIQLMLEKLAGEKISVTDKEIDEYLVTLKESSIDSETEEPTREEVKKMLEQQKVQENIQKYLADLKTKAKINYLIEY